MTRTKMRACHPRCMRNHEHYCMPDLPPRVCGTERIPHIRLRPKPDLVPDPDSKSRQLPNRNHHPDSERNQVEETNPILPRTTLPPGSTPHLSVRPGEPARPHLPATQICKTPKVTIPRGRRYPSIGKTYPKGQPLEGQYRQSSRVYRQSRACKTNPIPIWGA